MADEDIHDYINFEYYLQNIGKSVECLPRNPPSAGPRAALSLYKGSRYVTVGMLWLGLWLRLDIQT